jgi:hypothetical protein
VLCLGIQFLALPRMHRAVTTIGVDQWISQNCMRGGQQSRSTRGNISAHLSCINGARKCGLAAVPAALLSPRTVHLPGRHWTRMKEEDIWTAWSFNPCPGSTARSTPGVPRPTFHNWGGSASETITPVCNR